MKQEDIIINQVRALVKKLDINFNDIDLETNLLVIIIDKIQVLLEKKELEDSYK